MKRLCLMALLALLWGCERAPATVAAAAGPQLGLPPLPAAPAASPAVVALGRKLFMDRRLSVNGTMACAMCHIPEQGFAAVQLGTSVGIEGRTLRRNAPTLLNIAYVNQLFHDGRSASLEQQAWDPLLNPIEMGNHDTAMVIDKIASLPDYAGRFEAAFGGAAAGRDNVAAALAGFQRTLLSGNAAFDRWRYGGDATALNAIERAGFAVFNGKGRCSACHTVGERSALLTDGRFHNTGIGAARQRSAADLGRRFKVQLAAGIETELSEQDLANVSEALQADEGRAEVSGKAADRWSYRTPSLRNVAVTAPYMHDGSLPTLEAVIDFYQRGGIDNPGKSPLLSALALSEENKRSLAAFLRTLTGDNVEALGRQVRAE